MRFYLLEKGSRDQRYQEHPLHSAWLIADSRKAIDFEPVRVPIVDLSTVDQLIGADFESILDSLGFLPFTYRIGENAAKGVIIVPSEGYLFRQQQFERFQFMLNSPLPLFQSSLADLHRWSTRRE